MRQDSSSNTPQLHRALLIGALVAAAVILAHYGLTMRIPILGLIFPVILIVSLFLERPWLIFICGLAATEAMLKLPGLPSAVGVPQLFQMLLIGWAILDAAMHKKKSRFSYDKGIDVWIALFFVNVIFLMVVTGAGFRIQGEGMYGGSVYLGLLMALGGYFAAVKLTFTEKQVKILIWSTVIASAIPAALQFIIYFKPSTAPLITKFISISTEYFLREQSRDGDATRWGQLSGFGYALVTIAYVVCSAGRLRTFLLILSLFMMGMTGFRSRIFRLVAMIFFSSIIYSKQRGKVFLVWIFIGLAGWGFLSMAATSLPLAIQRVVSFVPGVKVDAAMAKIAKSSGDWRFDMWKEYCIPNVPKHLFIGRGLVSDVTGFAWLQEGWYGSAEFAYHMHAYHSGPFSLLLDFGLPGTITFTLFFLLVIKDGWQTMRRYVAHRNDTIGKYYIFLVILMSYELFSYFFIFGSVPTALPRMLVEAAILRILKKHFLLETLPAAGFSGVTGQTSGVSSATQQRTTSNRTPVNHWARPGAARR